MHFIINLNARIESNREQTTILTRQNFKLGVEAWSLYHGVGLPVTVEMSGHHTRQQEFFSQTRNNWALLSMLSLSHII